MCFSAIAAYAPRPVQDTNGNAPFDDTAWKQKIDDPNLYRPQVTEPPQAHHHETNRPSATEAAVQAAVASAGVTTVESTIITMPDGRRMMITPLD
jgi:hypothetical protein